MFINRPENRPIFYLRGVKPILQRPYGDVLYTLKYEKIVQSLLVGHSLYHLGEVKTRKQQVETYHEYHRAVQKANEGAAKERSEDIDKEIAKLFSLNPAERPSAQQVIPALEKWLHDNR
jgi:hypothetical protein